MKNNINQDKTEDSKHDDVELNKRKRTGILRILAGGYLVYLFYTSVIEPLLNNTFDMKLHFILIFIAYLIIGLILLIDGLRKIKK
ncbi:MAG: hypothetical protein GX323_05215 [Clostridiales bacterium]|nr:hypothetical protein [Clostridiales bacterium]